MFPLRDNVPARKFPAVNIALIAANFWAFFRELALGERLDKLLFVYGLVPARYAAPGALSKLGLKLYLLPFLTTMFLHGGWLHILSNMWCLYIFGKSVEDRLGHLRYLLFYLLSGLAASLAQLWASWGSPYPTIGASGAIAGVMGAYFVLYPFARVVCLIPIFIFLETVEIPAFIFLGLWLWSQLAMGRMALAGGAQTGGVAWWAHVGGFMGGVLLLALLRPRSRRSPYYD